MSLDEQSFGVSFTLFAQLLLNDLTSVFVGNLSSQAKIYIGCPKSCQLEPEYHYVLRHIFNLRKRDCHPLLRTEEEPGGFLIFAFLPALGTDKGTDVKSASFFRVSELRITIKFSVASSPATSMIDSSAWVIFEKVAAVAYLRRRRRGMPRDRSSENCTPPHTTNQVCSFRF